jgi:hypothetical protein
MPRNVALHIHIFQQATYQRCALKNNSLNSQHETRLAKENKEVQRDSFSAAAAAGH